MKAPVLTREELAEVRAATSDDLDWATGRDFGAHRMGRYGVSEFNGAFLGWIDAQFAALKAVCVAPTEQECYAEVEAAFDAWVDVLSPPEPDAFDPDKTDWPMRNTAAHPAPSP